MRQNVWWHSICPAVLLLTLLPELSLFVNTYFVSKMTFELAISLLRQGNNGDQILQILDSIAIDNEQGTVTDLQGNPVIW
jgi:hypothetical protein